MATKKGRTTNFFSPLSFVAVFGSGMDKNQDPGSGINIPDPQHVKKNKTFHILTIFLAIFHIFGAGLRSVLATISLIFPEMQESKFPTQVAIVTAGPITSYKPFFLLHVDQLESDLVVLVDLENFSLLKRSKIMKQNKNYCYRLLM